MDDRKYLLEWKDGKPVLTECLLSSVTIDQDKPKCVVCDHLPALSFEAANNKCRKCCTDAEVLASANEAMDKLTDQLSKIKEDIEDES